MSKRDDKVYLRHILDAIDKIEEYLKNIDEDRFKSVTLLQDGVIRQIQIIGEAAQHLSSSIVDIYTDVPWGDIAGMRHKLVHDYFGVDIDAVWKVAKEDIPELKKKVKQILG